MAELVESMFAKAKIIEREKDKLPEGVLCRAEYPICNLGSRNANNRIYEDDVWDKVLNDKNIVGKMESRALFGHAEHPETLQSNVEKASHVVTGISVDKEDRKVNCTVDVLDTPHGKIVDTILKADCGIGMSTRAEGDLEESTDSEGTYFKVKPNSYNFITVDFTADPSTFGTLPTSVERNVVQEIRKGVFDNQVSEDFALTALKGMKTKEASSLFESISNKDVKKEVVNEQEDKEKDLLKQEKDVLKQVKDLERDLSIKVKRPFPSTEKDVNIRIKGLKKRLGILNKIDTLQQELNESVEINKNKEIRTCVGCGNKTSESLTHCPYCKGVFVPMTEGQGGTDFKSMVEWLEKYYAGLDKEQKKQLSESIRNPSDFKKSLVKNQMKDFLDRAEEGLGDLEIAFDDGDIDKFKKELNFFKDVINTSSDELNEIKKLIHTEDILDHISQLDKAFEDRNIKNFKEIISILKDKLAERVKKDKVPEKKPKGFKDASKLIKMKEKFKRPEDFDTDSNKVQLKALVGILQSDLDDLDDAILKKSPEKFRRTLNGIVEFLLDEKDELLEDKEQDEEKLKVLYDRILKLHETRGELRNLLKGEKQNVKKMFKDFNKQKERLTNEISSLEQDKDELKQLVEHFKIVSDVMEENIEKEIKKLKESHTQELINVYVDSKIKWSGLKLSERTLALLKECKTNDEVDTMLDGIQGSLKESKLHYNMPKEIEVSGIKDPEVDKINTSVATAMSGM